MDSVPEKFIDKDKYMQAKKYISEKIPVHSIYRSIAIIDYYKKNLDGRIDDKKEKKSGIKRWLDEKWIVVDPYIKENKIVKCGSSEYKNKSACRPMIEISDDTPITIDEVIKKHGKIKVLEAIAKKNRDPHNLILNWHTLTIKRKK